MSSHATDLAVYAKSSSNYTAWSQCAYSSCSVCCSCRTRSTHKTCSRRRRVITSCSSHRHRHRVTAGRAPTSRNVARSTASRTARCGARSASGRRLAIVSKNIDRTTPTDASSCITRPPTIRSSASHMLLSRRQTIDNVGQLFGRGLVSRDNRPMKSLNHDTRVTCHVTIVTTKNDR